MKGFYSPIERLAAESTRGKGTGAEFMTELSKRPGYKQAEVEDRDLQTLMTLPKMAREEFMAQLKAKPGEVPRERVFRNDPKDLTYEEEYDKQYHGVTGEPHHEDYTLPGGENYREILLQHPKGKFPGVEAHFGGTPNVLASIRVKDRIVPGEMGYTLRNKKSGLKGQHYGTEEEAQAAIQGYPENLRPMLGVVPSQGPDKKVLHIEEIQSDWHQQGREKGYAPQGVDLKEQARRAKLQHGMASNQLKEAKERSASIDRDLASDAPLFQDPVVRERLAKAQVEYNNRIMDLMPEVMKAEEAHRDAEQMSKYGIPDAPFKKNWHELALKRMIQHAAENGYDQIAITPGAEQAKRFGLSQHVKALAYNPDTKYFVAQPHPGGRTTTETDMTPEKLPGMIGKEATQKLLSSPRNEHGAHTLQGQDLEVGGEGMKGFYDKMVPTFLNQFGKKYGAQVQRGMIDTVKPEEGVHHIGGDEYHTEPYGTEHPSREEALAYIRSKTAKPVHSFPITPEMRQDVMKNGISMYAEGGAVDNKAKFLKGSKVPERVYHGTSNLEGLQSFDPAMTGKGTDQLGSGFYFTTHPDEASGYASMPNSPNYPKFGGGDSAGMVAAHLAIKKPIKIGPKGDSLNDARINLSHDQVKQIIGSAPNILDPNESPLGNHININRGVTPKMIHDISKLYTGNQLHALENDIFSGHPTEYRHALHKATGHDGVMKDFGDGHKHYVAWFPEQIKSAIGNRGTYDPAKADITKAKGGVVSRETIKPVAHGIIKERVTVSPNLDAMQYELLSAKHFTKKVK